MHVEYVAFDSLGVKSSCVKIETDDVVITIDPGIAEEVDSFPLPLKKRMELRRRYANSIKKAIRDADIVVISHYHYDHHIPDKNLYRGKTLLVKDPVRNINSSQRKRAEELLITIEANVKAADGREFRFGDTKIWFSKPLWHGVEETNLGKVIMVGVDDGSKKLLHTSDVDGPILEAPVKIIKDYKPDIIIIDGPPTYILGYLHSYYNLARSTINLIKIMEETDAELIILDHHLLRDYRYRDLLYPSYLYAERNSVNLKTVAELLGFKPAVLEGFERNGPTKWRTWQRFDSRGIMAVLQNAVKHRLISRRWLKEARETLADLD